jgi:hypothetical protein
MIITGCLFFSESDISVERSEASETYVALLRSPDAPALSVFIRSNAVRPLRDALSRLIEKIEADPEQSFDFPDCRITEVGSVHDPRD